jgi:hypothetical protein
VLVDLVEEPEASEHLAELGLGAEGQREERQVGLSQLHVERPVPALEFLAGLEDDDAARVGVDLAEEGDLDRAREEAVAAAREGARVRVLHLDDVKSPTKSPTTPMSNSSWPGPRCRYSSNGSRGRASSIRLGPSLAGGAAGAWLTAGPPGAGVGAATGAAGLDSRDSMRFCSDSMAF